jgi:hypothetical protein
VPTVAVLNTSSASAGVIKGKGEVFKVNATRGIRKPSVAETISNAASGVVVPIPTCAFKDSVKSMTNDKDKIDFITGLLIYIRGVKVLYCF